jgi:hypothetical protein
MTPEQQRIAIAEACEWYPIKYTQDGYADAYKWAHPDGRIGWGLSAVPNYTGDLNAMHEAEKVLTRDQQGIYEVILRETVCGKSGFWYVPHACEVFAVSHATATQRAEAFLRTLNLWITT